MFSYILLVFSHVFYYFPQEVLYAQRYVTRAIFGVVVVVTVFVIF